MRPLIRVYCVLVVTLACGFFAVVNADEITAEGKKLAETLDSMDVEHLWLPGHSVAWKTGKPLKNPGEFRKSNTHCSAFVAATCLKMDVYILRPPEHETKDLANAQAEWLASKGHDTGWTSLKNGIEAQHRANQGQLVVAVFRESDPERHGHIAIIRPASRPAEKIQHEGPLVVQAGSTNANSTSLKEGFKHHHAAFPDGVKYYVHTKDP